MEAGERFASDPESGAPSESRPRARGRLSLGVEAPSFVLAFRLLDLEDATQLPRTCTVILLPGPRPLPVCRVRRPTA
jgi:hypothetical protein